MRHPSIAQVLNTVGFKCDPAQLIERLQIGFSYNEVIEGIQQAIEHNYIMLDADGYVVLDDGWFYYD